MATDYANIYACGDVTGPYQFTHVAAHQAWYATVNGLFGGFKRFAVDYSVIPWCTFTDPEVAQVGMTEAEAKARDPRCRTLRASFAENDRARTERRTEGLLKVVADRRGRTLGDRLTGTRVWEWVS